MNGSAWASKAPHGPVNSSNGSNGGSSNGFGDSKGARGTIPRQAQQQQQHVVKPAVSAPDDQDRNRLLFVSQVLIGYKVEVQVSWLINYYSHPCSCILAPSGTPHA